MKTPNPFIPGARTDSVWPSRAYDERLKLLRAAIGSEIYVAEVNLSEINLSVTLQSKAYELLDVVDFPRPDPANGLYPHILILDDGRGINLGRIARVSLNRNFQPAAEDILFQDEVLLEEVIFCERRLSQDHVKAVSKAHLGTLLGKGPAPSPETALEPAAKKKMLNDESG